MKNKPPKISFQQMPIDMEVEIITEFLETNWKTHITKIYPEFINVNPKNKEKVKKIIIDIRGQLKNILSDSLKNIKGDWQKGEDNVFKKLSEIIYEDWPEKKIKAYISINPICPRFLDTWNFSVSPFNKNINSIIVHEISHFLYFKKFEKVFPEISKKHYDFPYKEWLLSEIIAPLIVNDKRIQKIINEKAGFYMEHRDLEIQGKKLTMILNNLYNQKVIKENDFENFIKDGMKIIKKLNMKKINNI
jgi:hypothetical protein